MTLEWQYAGAVCTGRYQASTGLATLSFVLFGLACAAFALLKALGATSDSWGPVALLAAILAAPLAGHRWIWGPLLGRKAARNVTLAALVAVLVACDGFLGLAGIVCEKFTGYNPRATLMDLGFPTPEVVRNRILNRRADAGRDDGCRTALADGTMLSGKSAGVSWVYNCRDLVPEEAQLKACVLLAASRSNSVNHQNEAFCTSLGIPLKQRPGAFPN